MAFDPRLIGLWTLAEADDGRLYEWTASGRLFIHDRPAAYRIDADGRQLHWGGEPAFARVGEPAHGLTGSWQRQAADGDTETLSFAADGSYLQVWDAGDNYWGLYDDLGDALRTIEYRGCVTTSGDRYQYRVGNDRHEYRYALSADGRLRLYDDANGLQYHYQPAPLD